MRINFESRFTTDIGQSIGLGRIQISLIHIYETRMKLKAELLPLVDGYPKKSMSSQRHSPVTDRGIRNHETSLAQSNSLTN